MEDGLPAAGLWVILTGSMDLRARGRADPGARAGRVLRASLDAHRHVAHVHRARARALDVRAAQRRGWTPPARDRGGRRLRGGVDAKAPHLHRPHRARAARRRHHAGVGDHGAGGVLFAGRLAARGGAAARAGRRLGAARPARGRGTRDPDRRRRARRGRGRRGAARRAGSGGRAQPGADRPGRSAGDRGDGRDAGGRLGAPGRGRRRADLRRAVGHRPAEPRRSQPDRAAPRAARRPGRGCAGARRRPDTEAVPAAERGPASLRASSAACSASSTTRSWRG